MCGIDQNNTIKLFRRYVGTNVVFRTNEREWMKKNNIVSEKQLPPPIKNSLNHTSIKPTSTYYAHQDTEEDAAKRVECNQNKISLDP